MHVASSKPAPFRHMQGFFFCFLLLVDYFKCCASTDVFFRLSAYRTALALFLKVGTNTFQRVPPLIQSLLS